MDWVAVLVVLGVLGLIAVGFVFRARDQRLRAGQRVSEAAVEIDGLFAPARKHTVEYFHAQRMHREDVASPDGDDPDDLREIVRRAIDVPSRRVHPGAVRRAASSDADRAQGPITDDRG